MKSLGLVTLVLLIGILLFPAQSLALDRQEAFALYKKIDKLYMVPHNWTGSAKKCIVGREGEASINATLEAVNGFRKMAGVRPVVFTRERNREALAAALMMNAQGTLDHYPTPDWRCYSEEGANGASSSNLAIGTSGVGAMVLYMADFGVPSLGHRHWLLNPAAEEMGTGSTGFVNALSVIGQRGWSSVPTDSVVAWPPPGWVPKRWVFPDWSIQLGNSRTEFSGTPSIKVTMDGVETQVRGFEENNTVITGYKWWLPSWVYGEWRAGDIPFDVNISGLMFREKGQGAWRPMDISYRVNAFDTEPVVREPWLFLKVLSRTKRHTNMGVNFSDILGGRKAHFKITRFRIMCDATGYCIPRKKKIVHSRMVYLRQGMQLRAPRPSNDFMFYVDIKTESWQSGGYFMTSARDRHILEKRRP